MQYIIGCSGFHYKHWKGQFYSDGLAVKNWFEFYCQHFNTLELNVTFYRFPKLSTLQQWHEKSPDHFIFSVKVPRSITHFKKLIGTGRMLEDFYGLVQQGLQDKLGSVLFQFPPNFVFNGEHLDRLLNSLDPSFENVVEFRHPSWWNSEVFDQLAEHQIAFCGMSHPEFPNEIIANTAHVYYRMHGSEQLYASSYSPSDLSDVISKISSFPHVQKAYIYFNNDIDGYANENAKTLIGLSKGR